MHRLHFRHWWKGWRHPILWGGGALLVSLFTYGIYLHFTLTLPRGEDRDPLRIYAAPLPLRPGLQIERVRLKDRLDRLGYRQVSREVLAPGEYHMTPAFLDIYLRDFLYPEGPFQGSPLRLLLQDGQVKRVVRLFEGEDIFHVHVEPQLIGGILGTTRQVREWVPLSSAPKHLVEAILLIEDHRFYRHIGLDPLAVARAVWENLKGGEVLQGGSTITQQLAKNLYYTHRRTLLRKIKESVAAVVLEMKYTKEEILESYLNEIYLGQLGSVAIYGVGEAARHYFGKPVQGLTIAEAALLAGMIKAPNTYSPLKDPRQAKRRRDLVLRRLRQEKRISARSFQVAVTDPVRLASLQGGISDAPYFVDYLLHQFEASPKGSLPPSVKVFTTLDPEMQRAAEEVVKTGLKRLEGQYPSLRRKGETLQGALVALDPKTGAILAMVGGRDYRHSQFNRAVQMRRQAGSLLKPFVYLAAFESSLTAREGAVTPASLVLDAPVSFPRGKASWSPQNYDRQFRGAVTVRTALEQSLNVPAVRMAQAVGVRRIIQIMRDLGINGPLEANLSLALGTPEVSLLEITAAFGALAQGGRFVLPTGIRAVVEQGGEVVWKEGSEARWAVSPQAAYLVTSLLKGVVERGTAVQAKAMGLPMPVAGKTGTTDDYRDAWFVGYTPELVVGVWVGFDERGDLRLSGAQAALPLWVDFVRQVIPPNAPDFPLPPGIIARKIDPRTGLLATSRCPEAVEEFFIEGTEPTRFCDSPGPGS